MKQKNPTYLLNRNGIYYFQLRIPKHIKNDYDGKTFIRCSLKTSCRLEALNKARILWVRIMSKKKISIEQMENEIDKQAEQYRRGKILSNKFEALDSNDSLEIDEFFAHEFGTGGFTEEFDKEAFIFYQENHLEKEQNLSSPVKLPKPKSIALSQLVDDFIKDKSIGNNWSEKTKYDYEGVYRTIVEMCEDVVISDLSYSFLIQKFSQRLQLVPSNLNKKKIFRNFDGSRKSFQDCLDITKTNQLPTLSTRTQKKYVDQFKSLLDFGKAIYSDIPSTYVQALKSAKSFKNKKSKAVKHFTHQEIMNIFTCEYFKDDRNTKRYHERHWGMLLALYTGARANEIAQILVSEIKEENGIWFIDIEDEEDKKRLKTENSRRIVPIHPDLISLGFLDFIEQVKKSKSKNLFCRLKANKREDYHRKLTSWFLKNLRDKLAEENKLEPHKNFHSFRHTNIHQEKLQRLDRDIMSEIVGHSSGKTTTHDSYYGSFTLEQKYDELQKLNFNLDLSKIKKWKKLH